jgi:dihydrofolate synthase/folylpolyglutamate synthase
VSKPKALTYDEAIKWIYDLSKGERSNMRMGLTSITELCKRVGDPQDSFSSVHITGTNGKGSVAHMIESVLRVKGRTTGLYTSPHLQSFRERIQVKGDMIKEGRIAALAQELYPHVEEMGGTPSFFDVTTALAFMHFKDNLVDKAVIEVGLGGRLDSTNVLRRVEVCVMTSAGLDHTDVLGKGILSIVREKAAIAKKFSVLVVGEVPSETFPIIVEIAHEKGVETVRKSATLDLVEASLDGTKVKLKGDLAEYDFKLPLIGKHQAINAAVAVAALENMSEPPTKGQVEKGLSIVEVPGRLEVVKKEPLVLLDGAHNPAAGAVLAKALLELYKEKRVILVIGMMKDKDMQGFVDALAPATSAMIATKADSLRALPPEDIVKAAQGKCGWIYSAPTVKEAMELALEKAGKDGVVVATGSFYVVGEARQMFKPF